MNLLVYLSCIINLSQKRLWCSNISDSVILCLYNKNKAISHLRGAMPLGFKSPNGICVEPTEE